MTAPTTANTLEELRELRDWLADDSAYQGPAFRRTDAADMDEWNRHTWFRDKIVAVDRAIKALEVLAVVSAG